MKQLTPMMAIKKKCKESCCSGDLISWKGCSVRSCPLWIYRLGKRPQKEDSEPKVADLSNKFEKEGILGEQHK